MKFLNNFKLSNKALDITDKTVCLTGKQAICTDLRSWMYYNFESDRVGVFNLAALKLGLYQKVDEVENFPLPENSEFTQTCKIEGELLSQGKPFLGKDDLRPQFLVGLLNNDMFYATNQHVLLFKETGLSVSNIQIPIGAMSFKGEVEIHAGDKYTKFANNGFELIFQNLITRFPDYNQVIPTNNSIKAKINSSDLLNEMPKLLMSSNKNISRGVFTFSNNSLKIEASNIDTNTEYACNIQCESTDEIIIGFDLKLLKSILPKGEILLELSSPSMAIVINKEMLIMPIMLGY